MYNGLLNPKIDFIFKKIFGSEKVRSLENDVIAIKKAKDELVKISVDKKQRELYEIRKKSVHDAANAISSAKEEGELKAKIEIAKNLIDILDDETIALKTGLNVEVIKKLRI